MSSLPCPSHPEEMAEYYSLKKLPPEAAASYEEHLLICSRCASAVEWADEFLRVMRAALDREVPKVA